MKPDVTMVKVKKMISPRLHRLKFEMGANSFSDVIEELIKFWYQHHKKTR